MQSEFSDGSLFVPATRAFLDSLVFAREGETRIGQKVQVIQSWDELAYCPARMVLIGIPEDIGVRANYGVGGTHTLWGPALRALLNTQDSDGCPGAGLLVAGAFHFEEWMEESRHADILRLRSLVAGIDEVVSPLIERVVRAGKIPIVIGGGHNNAYPILRGTSRALGTPIHAMNLDAHSDYRRMEGRHSGNPFRCAREQGFLSRYAMIGLHEAYNSPAILDEMQQEAALHFSTYESIFLEEGGSFDTALTAALQHTSGAPVGIELDLDCIRGVLASAATPCGISTLEARRYLRRCVHEAQVAYVHIAEGAVQLNDGRHDIGVAKLVAYLVREVMTAFTAAD